MNSNNLLKIKWNLAFRDFFNHNGSGIFKSNQSYLREAVEWLARGQDSTPDDGVSRIFSLANGWNSSYPETTGYIIPTFLA